MIIESSTQQQFKARYQNIIESTQSINPNRKDYITTD